MKNEGHLLVRVCVSLGAIVVVMSSILLEIARAEEGHVSAMQIGWLALGAGIALILCGVERLFVPGRIGSGATMRSSLLKVLRAGVVGALTTLLLVLAADTLLEGSKAAAAMKSMVIPSILICAIAYGFPTLVGSFWADRSHTGVGPAQDK